MKGYDLIGDIHGHVEKLLQLLAKLGYVLIDGAYQHPTQRAIFLGDFIDRGPSIRDTLQVVRSMVEAGALAVLGNHEFNALCYAATGDLKLRRGLQRTLDEFSGAADEWADYLNWFRSLPFYLELKGLRVVHAVWDDRHMATLSKAMAEGNGFWAAAPDPESEVGRAINVLLNGFQVDLPGRIPVEEFEGSTRSFMRVVWWLQEGPLTYRRASFPFDPNLPETELPREIRDQLPGYSEAELPVFFGHYALPPDLKPWPQTANLACIDYRAAKRGPLVAYRWDGEAVLSARKFVSSSD